MKSIYRNLWYLYTIIRKKEIIRETKKTIPLSINQLTSDNLLLKILGINYKFSQGGGQSVH